MDNRVKQFNDIEKKYNLYHDKIGKINYWMYSRFDIWNYIISAQDHSIGKAHNQQKGFKNKVKSGVGLLVTLLFEKKVKKKNVDILFLNHERKVKTNGFYECKYTASISRLYENIYIFERPYEMGHLKPTDKENLIFLDSVAVKGNMKYQIIRHFCRKQYQRLLCEIKIKISKPIAELEEILHVSLDHDYIIQLIAKRILICIGKYKEYEKIFQKIHPKLIIEVVHYNMDCMIVNEIAKREGIRTVELQHGNIFDSHVPYQYDSEMEIKQLPDEIWLLSEYWKKVIHMPINDKYLIPVGFPYFENQIKKYKDNYKKCGSGKTVIFISQWTIGNQLSEFAVAFADIIEKENYRILYKLHPGELASWKEQYVELRRCEAIQVIDKQEEDLYQLFAESDIQVGVYSTAIYEGIGFGLDTYICDLPYAKDMEKLYQDGYASLVKTPEELKEFIENKEKINVKVSDFWTKDSLSNMKKQMNRILNEKDGIKSL